MPVHVARQYSFQSVVLGLTDPKWALVRFVGGGQQQA